MRHCLNIYQGGNAVFNYNFADRKSPNRLVRIRYRWLRFFSEIAYRINQSLLRAKSRPILLINVGSAKAKNGVSIQEGSVGYFAYFTYDPLSKILVAICNTDGLIGCPFNHFVAHFKIKDVTTAKRLLKLRRGDFIMVKFTDDQKITATPFMRYKITPNSDPEILAMY